MLWGWTTPCLKNFSRRSSGRSPRVNTSWAASVNSLRSLSEMAAAPRRRGKCCLSSRSFTGFTSTTANSFAKNSAKISAGYHPTHPSRRVRQIQIQYPETDRAGPANRTHLSGLQGVSICRLDRARATGLNRHATAPPSTPESAQRERHTSARRWIAGSALRSAAKGGVIRAPNRHTSGQKLS